MSRKNLQPWQSDYNRYYCEICNVWMGSDRQSILLHENGKKHQLKVQETLTKKRQEKIQQEQQAQFLQQSLRQMEQTALQKTTNNHYNNNNIPPPPPPPRMMGMPIPHQQNYGSTSTMPSSPAMVQSIPTTTTTNNNNNNGNNTAKQEKQQWQAKKQKRKLEHDNHNNNNDDNNYNDSSSSSTKRFKYIEPDTGYYTIDNNKTFLEGPIYQELLEPDMPIQLWTGNITSTSREKQLNNNFWKPALVIKVYRKTNILTKQVEMITAQVSYLDQPNDTQETILENVPMDRIRIPLGESNDPNAMVPSTVQEARLLAMGGQVEIAVSSNKQQQQQQAKTTNSNSLVLKQENDDNNNNNNNDNNIDNDEDATGFGGWSTVSIKQTSVHLEAKLERQRQRQEKAQQRQSAQAKEQQRHIRDLELAQKTNRDDSALGAYDVFGRGSYKGIVISNATTTSGNAAAVEQQQQEEDTTKKLSQGKTNVAFKKKSVKKKNVRKTFSDD